MTDPPVRIGERRRRDGCQRGGRDSGLSGALSLVRVVRTHRRPAPWRPV